MPSALPGAGDRPAQGCVQKGEMLLMVLSAVALDLVLVQFDPNDTVTSNQ
jgi:hypothetical protein